MEAQAAPVAGAQTEFVVETEAGPLAARGPVAINQQQAEQQQQQEQQPPAHEALSRSDVLLEVLCRLPRLSDLAGACLVGRAWRRAAEQDLPWRRIYVRLYGEPQAQEACSSYREQGARRAGLRAPYRAPLLPGPPPPRPPPPSRGINVDPLPEPVPRTPCTYDLETYDTVCGVRTLAVSYDPVTGLLLRAVKCRQLVGDQLRIAVQAVPLGPQHQRPTGGPSNQQQQQQQQQRHQEAREPEQQASLPEAGGGGASAAPPPPPPQPQGPWLVCMLSPDGLPPPPTRRARLPCWPDPEGPPPLLAPPVPLPQGPLPPPLVSFFESDDEVDEGDGDGPVLTAAASKRIAALAELLCTVMCCAGGLLYLPAGPGGQDLAVWDLAAAAAASASAAAAAANAAAAAVAAAAAAAAAAASAAAATSSASAAAASAAAGAAPGTAAPACAAAAPVGSGGDPPAQAVPALAGGPHWLASGAHPGRLLAAAADGALAVSGCDGGRLAFWGAGGRRLLGSADIGGLTSMTVFSPTTRPMTALQGGRPRHRLLLAVCEAAGLAAVLLASPLTPSVHIFRAAPVPAAAGSGGSGAGESGEGGVGQKLRVLENTIPGDGLALFRGSVVVASTLCSDVMGARFGGSGGSSVLITVSASVWRMPSAAPLPSAGGGEAGLLGGGISSGAEGAGTAEGQWGEHERLYSSRLLVEHPRTMVLGRLRPQLAVTEDLLLLTLPRNAEGRWPHHELKALEHAFGEGIDEDEAEVEEDEQGEAGAGDEGEGGGGRDGGEGGGGGDGEGEAAAGRRCGQRSGGPAVPAARRKVVRHGVRGGSGAFTVISEEQRLPWCEVIKDAGDVVVALLPTPRYLALLTEDGRLRMYGLLQDAAGTAP